MLRELADEGVYQANLLLAERVIEQDATTEALEKFQSSRALESNRLPEDPTLEDRIPLQIEFLERQRRVERRALEIRQNLGGERFLDFN